MPDAVTLNLYEILGISRDSPAAYAAVAPAEIKQGYHAALLAHHPDKQQQRSSSAEPLTFAADGDDDSDITIPAIKTAYLILANDTRRRDYDAKLKLGGASTSSGLAVPKAASDQVDLDDMECQVEVGPDGVSETCTWTRSCRCGEEEGYIVNELDLEANGAAASSITVQCVGCSLWIEVLYEVMN